MYVAATDESTGEWGAGGLQPYGPMQLFPSAQALNYGQAIFEGMKAQRSAGGRIVLFRPDCNAERMAEGAARMSMAVPPKDLFLRAVVETVKANAAFIPPAGKGSLYLRPLLLGSGPILGLGPAPAYTLVVYCAAVGAYFKGGQLSPIDLLVETRFHRAAPGGMGGTKCAGNYSPVLVTQLAAKKDGYADVVYLDAKSDTYLEEVSSCNLFAVKGRTIRTPPLQVRPAPGGGGWAAADAATAAATAARSPCALPPAPPCHPYRAPSCPASRGGRSSSSRGSGGTPWRRSPSLWARRWRRTSSSPPAPPSCSPPSAASRTRGRGSSTARPASPAPWRWSSTRR